MLYQYQDAKPQISDNAFIAPTAVVLGQVTVGAGSSIVTHIPILWSATYVNDNLGISYICFIT